MFKVLIGSQPVRSGWLGSSAFSTVAHGGLIAAAVLTTGGVTAPVREKRDTVPTEHLTYLVTARPAPVIAPQEALRKNAPTDVATPKETQLVAPDAAPAQSAIDQALVVPVALNVPDLTALSNRWLTQPDALSTAPSTSTTQLVMRKLALARPEDGLYTEDMVEEAVAPERGNPTPRYPTSLRDMGIEGDFVVHFVVDSTGRVDAEHIEFPNAMHRLFMESVRYALLHSRYFPARVGGTPVPQLVVQEFRFAIRHGE